MSNIIDAITELTNILNERIALAVERVAGNYHRFHNASEVFSLTVKQDVYLEFAKKLRDDPDPTVSLTKVCEALAYGNGASDDIMDNAAKLLRREATTDILRIVLQDVYRYESPTTTHALRDDDAVTYGLADKTEG